jgi:hypothetical protein
MNKAGSRRFVNENNADFDLDYGYEDEIKMVATCNSGDDLGVLNGPYILQKICIIKTGMTTM